MHSRHMESADFASLVSHLREILGRPLPGAEGQALMAPRPRPGWRRQEEAASKRAAVLLFLYPRHGRANLVLTRRTATVEFHRNQVSLPGGAMEPGESAEEGALREAREEVGLVPEEIEILGRLSPLHVPVSGFRVIPVVGFRETPPPLEAYPPEVAEIVEVPIADFVKEGAVGWSSRERPGGSLQVPFFFPGGLAVWGATAMILSEFLTLLGWTGPPDPPLDDGA